MAPSLKLSEQYSSHASEGIKKQKNYKRKNNHALGSREGTRTAKKCRQAGHKIIDCSLQKPNCSVSPLGNDKPVSEKRREKNVMTCNLSDFGSTHHNGIHSSSAFQEYLSPSLTLSDMLRAEMKHLSASPLPVTRDINSILEATGNSGLGEPVSYQHVSPKNILSTLSRRKKKNKGRNGNIYIGVTNRMDWLELQKKFGFENVNSFGTFVLQFMRRVHSDVETLGQVAKKCGRYSELKLNGCVQWVNGDPYPINESGAKVDLSKFYCNLDHEERVEMFNLMNNLIEDRQKMKTS